MFTIVHYYYRDASNYKASHFINLAGLLSESDIGLINAKLSDGEFFIPNDLEGLALPELQDNLSSFPSEDDHVWHTLDLDEREEVSAVAEGQAVIPAREFVAAFERIKDAESWNVVQAVERLGL